MTNTSRQCPAVLIAAPGSNQGKTTVTAALARYHRNAGRHVRVFKAGPDFLDPMIHEHASGNPVYSLDLWMVGEAACKQYLYQAAETADLIIIECGMGLYDGKPSSADLARTFGVPVLALIDAASMAQTFGALAYGLANYQKNLPFAGVIANRVASENHNNLLRESVPPNITYFGGIPRNPEMHLPDRHLGLVQAGEISDLEQRLEIAASIIAEAGVESLPAPVSFEPGDTQTTTKLLEGVTIGIARDTAFGFIYPANLDTLRELGAQLVFFSPLDEQGLPEIDSLWLPGGYPELHLQKLAENNTMKSSILNHIKQNKPTIAECGGMLYLLDSLADRDGVSANMVGAISGQAAMQTKLAGLGMQSAALPEGTFRGHTFHHTASQIALEPLSYCTRQRGSKPGEAIYRRGRLHASYLHLYFASNVDATAKLFHPSANHNLN